MIGEEFAGLLAAAQGGGEAAFSRLWRNANPALLRYLRVIAPGAEEDIAAETWLHVVRGLPAFRGDEQAWRAWLFTTARRRTIDLARHRSRRPEAPLDDVTAAQLPSSADSAEAAMENLGTAAAIALLAGLPRLQAEVIMLQGGRRAGHRVGGADATARAQAPSGWPRTAACAGWPRSPRTQV